METIVLTPTQLANDVKLLPRFVNRSIDGKHVAKLKKSIVKFGVLRDSVTVRAPFIGHHLYTLDGQHLHQACIELNKSVRSKVVSVSSEKELINFISDMNSTSKKWSIIDHINSWAANGNEHYSFILSCLNKYRLQSPTTFLKIYNNGGKFSQNELCTGNFILKREYGDRLLDYYDILIADGLNTSSSSLIAWSELFKRYNDKITTSVVNKLSSIVKKNVKVYSQSVNTIQYITYLDAHINECF